MERSDVWKSDPDPEVVDDDDGQGEEDGQPAAEEEVAAEPAAAPAVVVSGRGEDESPAKERRRVGQRLQYSGREFALGAKTQ